MNSVSMRRWLLLVALLWMTGCGGRGRGVDGVGRTSPREAFVTLPGGTTMAFVPVPAGSFVMGSRLSPERLTELFGAVAGDPEANSVDAIRRRVTLTHGYWLGRTEVTNRQFAEFVAATGYVTEGERDGAGFVWLGDRWERVEGVTWRDYGRLPSPDEPVVMVTWRDAVAFTQWLARVTGTEVRLPTEAEWEYAARAAGDSEFAFGDVAEDLQRYGWCGLEESGVMHPQEVGRKLPNAWGLYDMHGNVFEWVQDWYGPLGTVDLVDPTGPATGQIKVVRGGSWAKDVGSCRSNHRAADRPTLAESHVGFRVLAYGLR